MSLISHRRSGMTLFTSPDDPEGHRVRIVLAEKDVTAERVLLDPAAGSEDLSDLNPYNSVPTLVDRELVLYDGRLIIEYLDERFPHPPLMPVDPVSRAKARLLMYRIERDWYALLDQFAGADKKTQTLLRKRLRESLLTSAALFMEARPCLLGAEFTLVDCTVIPVLWRLDHYGISLPPAAAGIVEYARRMFARPAVQASLTEAEREMRP